MFEITYIYTVILGCLFVYKTLANDPERDKIWGPSKQAKLKEKEILRAQPDHYKNFRSAFEQKPAREESSV